MSESFTQPWNAARWPRRIRFARSKSARLSMRIDLSAVAASLLLTVIALVVAVWSLGVSTTDTPNLGMWQTVKILAGQVTGAPAEHVASVLPAVTIAVLGGASLALSGAIFQTMTRNPLGSPDIIGFTTGANTGALVALLVIGTGSGGATIGALVGAVCTAAAVWLLGMRPGNGSATLIVVGIGISAMLMAFNGYLIATSNVQNAAAAASWGVGNLQDLQMSDVVPVAIALVVLVPALIIMAPRMRMLELSADSAQSTGVDAQRTQVVLLLIGVGFAAATTAVAGPVAFVALVAPQLAARLTPSAGIPLCTSAAVGAALLVSSDAIARTVLAPDTQLPVGVVTTAFGGLYLLGLLIAQSRRSAA